MANEKKTSRKKFRVAVSGSTVDGREISPVHLREAAENFNPDVYADCGDLPLALRIGAYVVRHNLIMPDNFGRTAATVLTEEICNPVLTQAGTDADADLSTFIEPLDTLWEIVANQDMPDEVRAKLCKACAFARRGLSDADSMASSLKLLREAMHLNPNAGVKREIATLSRALKKADSAAAPEDASTPQTQDESSKSKKTTRKPATRKTTATQKAKRG